MNEFFMEYELDVQKASHVFETAFDLFAITSIDTACRHSQGIITESSEVDDIILEETGKFIQAVKDFFKKLIDSCRKLIHDVSVKFSSDIQAKKVNARLKDLKDRLAKNREAAAGQKIDAFDTGAYLRAYTTYVNFVVNGYKSIYSKEYKNYEDFRKVAEKFNTEAEKKFKELKLSDEEAFEIKVSVAQAITMTEKELASMNSIFKSYEKVWTDAISDMESVSIKVEDSSAVADLKSAATKLTNRLSHALRNVTEAPVRKLSSIMKAVGGKISDSGEKLDKKLGVSEQQ